MTIRDRLTDVTKAVLGPPAQIFFDQALKSDRDRRQEAWAGHITKAVLDLQSQLTSRPGGVEKPLVVAPIPIATVLADWRSRRSGSGIVPLYIVVGGSVKYDPDRKNLPLKPFQSTAPVTGVVRVARALADRTHDRLVDAICDYSPVLRGGSDKQIDLIVVGGGDTNRLTNEFFSSPLGPLPAKFEPPTGSDSIVADGMPTQSSPETGLVVALSRPATWARFVLICAGNGAPGTNAALDLLASWLRNGQDQWPKTSAIVVEQYGAGYFRQVWPPRPN